MSEDVKPGWVRQLWGYMMRHKRNVVLAMFAAILGSICQTIIPLIAREIVDNVILSHHSKLWPWLVLLGALAGVSYWAAHVRRYRGGQVALEVQYDLRNEMHDHLQVMDFDNLGRMPTGQLVARANSDSTLVQGLLNFFPIMSSQHLVDAHVTGRDDLLVTAARRGQPRPRAHSRRRVLSHATKDLSRDVGRAKREGDVIQIVDEDVNGVRVVKAFGQEERELERVADASQVLYGSQMRAVRLQSRYQPLLEAIPTIAQVAILALGGWMALHHEISLGTFLAFSTYVTSMMAPARQLAGVLTIGQQARAGLERIFQLLELQPAIADAPDAVVLGELKGED